ncbi:hypothetical protein [Hydrogenivirga sp. 128-5-R1-1]|uniref:hypothetical protein n=1 Tax=Hydrogenivirga sp. 128-5-R1-1 TaxID=392423 RepID=UPI00015F3023|nr:hypothetical protein [Hydrogenivirga sp. 128-5-R1-1]EDP74474.1 hypothetical protein HG1285_09906 [Hydrogenivirga sp. 128-5-R1-1]
MRGVYLLVLVLIFLTGCASTTKTPIHKIINSDIVRTKVVLLERDNVEFAYQKAAVRAFEAELLKKPVTFAIRSTFSGKEIDFVLITRKEVQKIPAEIPQEIVRIGEESDINTLIVLEPLKVNFSEGSSKRGEEFCVTRRAEVLIGAKVFETKTGNLIFGGVYEGKAKARQCSKGIRRTDELPSKDALILKALRRAAIKFAGEFWSSL